jgi:hypothetical protein
MLSFPLEKEKPLAGPSRRSILGTKNKVKARSEMEEVGHPHLACGELVPCFSIPYVAIINCV